MPIDAYILLFWEPPRTCQGVQVVVTAVIEPCPDRITDQHRKQYAELGYVAFQDVLSAEQVAAACLALRDVSHSLMGDLQRGEARLVAAPAGAARNYAGPRVSTESGCAIHFEDGVDPNTLTPEEAELSFRKLHDYETQHAVFEELVVHERIRGFLADLIGQEMLLKATMALSKPPLIGSEKPWHQDNAYFNWLPLDLVGTCWIALDDATVDNGCMHLLSGQHKRGPLRHHHTIDCEILPDRIDPNEAEPVELRAGGILYFSALLPHQTPPNNSSVRRRALQFQYRGVEARQVTAEEFGKVFAEPDGRPASCALAYENG